MAFCAILRKSASSLALTASRLAQANRNYHSAVFSASSHLSRKPTLGSFVPDFEFSSATETKKCSSNIESLLQLAIDSEIERADYCDHVKKSRSEFTLKIENNAREDHVVLTREYQGELVEVFGYMGLFRPYGTGQTEFCVTISNNGESSLKFDCFGTSDAISIWRIGIINSEISEYDWPLYDGDDVVEFDNMDESMKKAFFEYLEIRGIKPSIVDFIIKCYRYKKAKKMSTLGSFVPDFEFSSAAETKKCSSNESLLQAIDSELKRIGHVEETPSEFTFELNRDFNKRGRTYAVLTKEFQGERVEVCSGYFYVPHFDFKDFIVTISKPGGSCLRFNCSYTPDGISILHKMVHDGGQYLERFKNKNSELDLDGNLKKAFQYLEVRGIKPSGIEFIFKCINNKYTKINLTVLKKIKNFIGQIA